MAKSGDMASSSSDEDQPSIDNLALTDSWKDGALNARGMNVSNKLANHSEHNRDGCESTPIEDQYALNSNSVSTNVPPCRKRRSTNPCLNGFFQTKTMENGISEQSNGSRPRTSSNASNSSNGSGNSSGKGAHRWRKRSSSSSSSFLTLCTRRRIFISLWISIIVIIFISLGYFITRDSEGSHWHSRRIERGNNGVGSKSASQSQPRYTSSHRAHRFSKAAVATDSPECSKVGAGILQKGGNAVDAAIAAGLCLGVRRPFASGIGGGGFMLVHLSAKEQQHRSKGNEDTTNSSDDSETPSEESPVTYSVDFREYAGKLAHRDMYEKHPSSRHYNPKKHPFHYGNFDKSTYGASSIAIPGEVKGYAVVHKKFGRLPWKDLFDDAIRYAEEGFHVESLLALRCQQRSSDILKSGSLTSLLTRPEEPGFFSRILGRKSTKRRVLREGDFVRQPELARTLRRIAKEGWKVFYEGDIMKAILKDIQAQDSYLTEEDFKKYTVRIRKAHQVGFHGGSFDKNVHKENSPGAQSTPPRYSIYTTHAPSSGVITAFALALLDKLNQREQFEPDAEGSILSANHHKHHHSNPFLNQNTRFWHHVIESLKHAFSHRTFLGDPHFVPGVSDLMHILSSTDYIEHIVGKVDRDKTFADWSHYAVNETLIEPHDSGTTALSVVDEDGNAVSMATTVNHSFGSLVYLPELGFIMNNHMSDFSVSRSKSNVFGFLPSTHNSIAPRKRPTSSMSPIVIVDHGAHFSDTESAGESSKVILAASASGGSTIISALVQTLATHLFHEIAPHFIIPQPRLHILPGMNEVRVEPGFSHMYLKSLEKKYGHKFRDQGILADGHSIGNVQLVVREKDSNVLEAFSDERKLGRPAGY